MSEIKIGQVWQEIDPRFPNMPPKTVVGFEEGKVLLSTGGLFGKRKTKAKPERFNGKRGGYRLIKDTEGAV
ncbi:hypothetical protein [Rhizobium lusitanum]|uniref:NUMOD4 domain-containing protein n=1 Tax=Rhizobium lusitanum TaxID=293958 RepID=A0A1C3VSL7_9HYPH|nr:hypothetical protein [Rhizobium lusitanum]SCB30762.1 hypothetical protein GA0061101_106154 [Rhizobium lusitanum]